VREALTDGISRLARRLGRRAPEAQPDDGGPAPWRALPEVHGRLPGVPTMLSSEELKLLYWLARDRYTGEGEIVDCGPFLGGSTCALAAGLEDNRRVARKDAVVHVFDRFLYEPYFAPWFAGLGVALEEGDSFAPVYRRLVAPYRRFLHLHEGDVLHAPYEGAPIEILFLDICKSWEINAAVLRTFFPCLVPGRSLLVQQDYLHHFAFWLVLTMDWLTDYFEPVGRVAEGHSVLYRHTRRIPDHVLHADLRALPAARKREAFEREVARSQGWQRTEVLVAYGRMLLEEGDEAGAREVCARIDPDAHDHPINRHALVWMPRHFFAPRRAPADR
jgi:hypothetical protein